MHTPTGDPTATAADRAGKPRDARRIVILLENLPLARDARVRRECRALLDAGYQVSVICPRGEDERVARTLPEVRLHTFRPAPEGTGVVGYVREYLVASVAMAALLAKVAATEGVDAIQACNPPDVFFVHAAPFRLAGRPFVFDHHDLSPELFTARSGRRGVLRWILEQLERLTLRTADHVIATNDSVREVALRRGGKRPEDVTVVRNGPELSRARPAPASKAVAVPAEAEHLLVWLGVMGPDDGVDVALRAVAHLVHDVGRRDVHAAFLGDGEWAGRLRGLAAKLDIEPYVTFTGWVEADTIAAYLGRGTLGLAPDPAGPRADRATMMKVMDYLAAGLPVVAFDVRETRISAGEAGVYVTDDDPAAYGQAIAALLDDPDRRRAMADVGRRRIEESLAWEHQAPAYVGVYDQLLGVRRTR
ncbi:MAG: glycosyltransferase family 4 protein [Nitriliruptoraceae bacterium]